MIYKRKACITALLFFAASQSLWAAEQVFLNAEIYTGDNSHPKATAMVVDLGKLVYVGNNETAKAYITDDTEVTDLIGGFVFPGFIDSHNHVFEAESEIGGDCELSSTARLKGQKRYLRACAKQAKRDGKRKGDWVMGYGHELSSFMGNNRQANPRALLDELFPDNPVVIMEESSHSMLVNSLALQIAGFDEDSKDPIGGTLMRLDSGKLNGVVFDNAGDIIYEIAWNSSSDLFEANYRGLLTGMSTLAKNGITTVGDGRMYWRRGWHDVWKAARDDGALTARVSVRPWVYPDLERQTQIDFFRSIKQADKQQLLIIDQVKMYSDGVLHFGTAKMLKPYRWSWQSSWPHGINYISPQAMKRWLVDLKRIGYGAHIHAIGDSAVRESLDAVEHSRKQQAGKQDAESIDKPVYSMTHLELIDNQDMGRFKSLDVHADFQAGAAFFSDVSWAREYLGRKRLKNMLPMRRIYDSGANVTFSSDWTVNPVNPLVAIANSMALKTGNGLPSIEAAIAAATINGAKALGLEAITGSISLGKSADFVILNRDISQLPPAKIRKTKVLMTVLQGRRVYSR